MWIKTAKMKSQRDRRPIDDSQVNRLQSASSEWHAEEPIALFRIGDRDGHFDVGTGLRFRARS